MQLLQDVLLPRGGAERVFRALEESRRFAGSTVGLSGVEDRAQATRRRVLCTLGASEEENPREALRRVVEVARRQPEIRTPTLVLHHHAGLQFPLRKGVATLYLHTPTRFLWEPNRASWEIGVFDRGELDELRTRELQNIEGAHAVATNSRYTARRVEAAYGRSTAVINPPCELWKVRSRAVEGICLRAGGYVITVSRLVSTKGLRQLMAATEAMGVALLVVGSGREASRLMRSSGDRVHFLGGCDDAELRWLLRNSWVFASFSREDFGLAAAEALCEGIPCVVPTESGVAECIDNESGSSFDLDRPGSFEVAMETAFALGRSPTRAVRAYRQHFSNRRFVDALVGSMGK